MRGYPEIVAAVVQEDYPTVIRLVRKAIQADPQQALSDPAIKSWLGQRYRNLFLTEAQADEGALRAAKVPQPIRLIDRRSGRELLATRYIKGVAKTEASVEMPKAKTPKLRGATLLFVPGLMSGLLPVRAFQSVFPKVEDRFGISILTADVHPVRSSHANQDDIAAAFDKGTGLDSSSQEIPGKRATAPGDVILLGYDKGAADALSFLVDRPEYRSRIRAFVSWAGVVGGSYIADEVFAGVRDSEQPRNPLSGQVSKSLRRMVPVVQGDRVHSRLEEYDVKGAIGDMTTATREQFLRDNIGELTALGIPSFTVAGVTSVLEVPYYQALGALQLNNYDKNNDMLLTLGQTRLPVPQATELATFRAHHWDLAYDPFPWFTRMGSLNVDHRFARYPALCALILFLNELGLLAN